MLQFLDKDIQFIRQDLITKLYIWFKISNAKYDIIKFLTKELLGWFSTSDNVRSLLIEDGSDLDNVFKYQTLLGWHGLLCRLLEKLVNEQQFHYTKKSSRKTRYRYGTQVISIL